MKLLVAIVAALLVGCASNSGVVSVGEGTLMIARQAATGFPGTGKIKTEALKEAGQYRAAQNKTMDIIKLYENEGPYIFGRYPRVELTFRCD